jgi:TonB family protein
LFSKQSDWLSLKNSRAVIDTNSHRPDSLEWDSFLVSFLLHSILFLIFWLFVPVIMTSQHNGTSDKIRVPIRTVIIDDTPSAGPELDLDKELPPLVQPTITPPQKRQVTPPTPPEPQKNSSSLKQPSEVIQTPSSESRPAAGPVGAPVGTPQTYAGDRESPILGFPVRPIYPKSALNFGWGGKVEVDFVVDSDGKIKDYTIVKSTGHPELDMAFVRYMQSQTLQPKRIRGQNIEAKIRMAHEFSVE